MIIGLDWVGFNPDYTNFFDIWIRSGLSIVSKICDLDRIWTELMENNCRILWESCIVIVKRIAGFFCK